MGKMNDSVQKRYRNNVRVDPASLNHYLCYFCGKTASDRMEYQLHMLKVHEVLSQSYQLWSDHTMDSLGLRWSETKGRDDRETSSSPVFISSLLACRYPLKLRYSGLFKAFRLYILSMDTDYEKALLKKVKQLEANVAALHSKNDRKDEIISTLSTTIDNQLREIRELRSRCGNYHHQFSPISPSVVPASPVSREPRHRNSDEDDEDYVYEEEKPTKRRKRDEERSRRSLAERQKRAVEEQRRKAEAAADRMRRAEEKRLEKMKRDEERRRIEEAKRALQQQAAADKVERVERFEKAERRLSEVDSRETPEKQIKSEAEPKRKRKKNNEGPPRWKDIVSEANKQEHPDVAFLVQKILAEGKKKEASSEEVQEEDLTPEIVDRKPFDFSKNATKYCKVCKKGTHYTFASLFEHYQDHHHAILKSFDYYGYNNKKLIGKKHLLERDYCQRCVMRFPRARDYFSHMIRHHINESVRCQLDFENANNADVEVRMAFRDRIITLGYNFQFEEETLLSDSNLDSVVDDFRAGTSSAAYQNYNEPSTSSTPSGPFAMDKQIKIEPPGDADQSSSPLKVPKVEILQIPKIEPLQIPKIEPS
ncbi:hypothetical protein GCK72_009317 [Caenorhabditis remanei]|uniref:C2H2-type domain-containing protein n=1 Tax=Caenorhabditis remanei TaxID=31234 RepID=A0A6A5H3F6_CAERE|nr:hypothetical protein GCK72_009317 [Caenorhabditis remanei]KAF1761063.1 hypothetical protein GCK72_009317 [Caenorhabditis remanei]